MEAAGTTRPHAVDYAELSSDHHSLYQNRALLG